jgi:hypothetical protein
MSLPRKALVCAVFLSFLSAAAVSRGQDPGRLQAHLNAGEFGPARRAAAGLPAPQRDQWLGRIANQQALAGARNAAAHSLSRISDDRARTDSVNTMRDGAVGDGFGRGGAAMADFDSLIDLITTTIEPESWDDVGGPGAIESFPGGVFVDGSGVLRKLELRPSDALAKLRDESKSVKATDIRSESVLRKVSLTRLEKELQILAATGRDPSEAMKNLAGIHKIKYVFVYPESGDVVIAGPAGDWRKNSEHRNVHSASGAPVLQLDDLVVMLRVHSRDDPTFGCSITPTKEGMSKLKALAEDPAVSKMRRSVWLERLQSTLGRQKIDVFGLDPSTRVAQVIVEADYRMKLVGMGLERGVLGVTSYLDALRLNADGSAPPTNVIRWWFTLNYKAITTTKDRNGFEFLGPGVKVLSENEMIGERGERIHTGKSDEPTAEFARSFTKHFPELATKHAVYAELRNVFDLALAAAVIDREDLAGQASWHMSYLLDPKGHQVAHHKAAGEVESIVGHRVFNRRAPVAGVSRQVTVAGVSGGVTANANTLVSAIKPDSYGLMNSDRAASKPSTKNWWWD